VKNKRKGDGYKMAIECDNYHLCHGGKDYPRIKKWREKMMNLTRCH